LSPRSAAGKRRKAKARAKAKATSSPKGKPMKHAAVTDLITVDNPAEHAERVVNPYITAIRTLRDDPIGHMHARGHLGALSPPEVKIAIADARLRRARLFQEAWEVSGRGGRLRSPDFDGVPGSSDPSRRSGFDDRQRRAGNQLDQWKSQLGGAGYALLKLILIDKCTIAEAARRQHGQVTQSIIRYLGHRLRECLDTLA
jgi:hypothetical protein